MHEEMPKPRSLTGKCLCERVEYEVADDFEYAFNCHCSQCRRTTGSAFKPLAGIEKGKLAVTQGESLIMKFGDGVGHDVHCASCGSLLYSVVREGRYVHVAMGTLVDTPAIRPTCHIFVASKAPWFEITDDLPQFDGFPKPWRQRPCTDNRIKSAASARTQARLGRILPGFGTA